jgi:hypothetical protein
MSVEVLFHTGRISYSLVVITLNPSYQAEEDEDLRLYAQRNVELFDDVVHAERDSGPCPEHHHG